MDVEYDVSAEPPDPADMLHCLGYFGHYLHVHEGGRGGKRFVLCTLHKCGGLLTQRELLEHTHTSSAALSEVLAKLESEQLISRKPYERDRRQLSIELTSRGRVEAAHVHSERMQFEGEAFACLTPREQDMLGRMLERLVTHWKELEEPKSPEVSKEVVV